MSEQAEIQRTIEKALAKRNKARSKKMWSVADDIRNMLKEMGVLIQDTRPNTSEWRWAKGALEDSAVLIVRSFIAAVAVPNALTEMTK